MKKSLWFSSTMAATIACAIPLPALAADTAVLAKEIESLSKQLDELRKQMQELQKQESTKEARVATVEKKTQETAQKVQTVEKKERASERKSSALEISGDYRFRMDSLRGSGPAYYSARDVMANNLNLMYAGSPYSALYPALSSPLALTPAQNYRNDSLLTNRFGLNLRARATDDITVKARLVMYKVWGENTYSPSPFFADRFYNFDGNDTHLPVDDTLRVDQAYATWSGIGDEPVWFSVGRRPSTGGIPTNLRQNIEKDSSDTAGVPGLLIDYAFDGATIGVAPDIAALPGAYAKFCYGKGFDSGITSASNTLKDVNFVGVNVVPYATDNLRVELQWDRAYNIFAFPGASLSFSNPANPTNPTDNFNFNNANLGDIDQYMFGVSGKRDHIGPGTLNLFLSGGISQTHPNGNSMTMDLAGGGTLPVAGLLYTCSAGVCSPQSKTGRAIYLGGRYDLPSGTKFGLEYNHGSENWVSFAPASDDMWTAKQGVRGNVYEVYLIHEINSSAISKYGKAQFRLGYQYYDFQYTGSNNWVFAPVNVNSVGSLANAQVLTPLKSASDIYLTFDVAF